MAKPKSRWTVGEKVLIERNLGRNYDRECKTFVEATVVKVARKWATLDYPRWRPDRVEIDGRKLDGGEWSSPGRAWKSLAERAAWYELQDAWAELMALGRYRDPPIGLKPERLRAFLAELHGLAEEG